MRKNKKKDRNKPKIDEYYNDGIIELLRTGSITSIHNVLDESQATVLVDSIKNRYDATVEEIDDTVRKLRELITTEDPLQLLKFCQQQFLISNIGITSEHQLTADRIFAARITEYVQSVIVSSNNSCAYDRSDPSERFFRILNLVEKLYTEIQNFYLCWAFTRKEDPFWAGSIEWILESLLAFSVRGNRYQVIEEKYHRALLETHDETLKQIYGVSATELVEGLLKLLYNLSQGTFDSANSIMEQIDTKGFDGIDEESVKRSFDRVFGYELNDVMKVTNWPEHFVRDLSYGIGESKCLFEEKSFAGWPLLNLPIQRKPFLFLKGKYYCFDYYSLSDNFYRSIQKAVNLHLDADIWKSEQQNASENSVGKIFLRLLPGAQVYRNNYYPTGKSLKNMAENDLLIIYDQIVIAVEVKAGAFTYTSPLTDFESHISSYKNLIEKADHQCERVADYINNCASDEIIFYDSNKREKLRLSKGRIEKTYKISVTVDSINSFAARAEKLGFLNLKSNAICLGLDDLITYSEYFDSPLIFLHYLRQRECATLSPNLQLYDELDHLGMYIAYNCYPMVLQEWEDNDRIIFDGFREELDTYFGKLIHPFLNPEKPVQEFPKGFLELIRCIEKEDDYNKVWLSSYLLNFDGEAREGLCQYIKTIIERQTSCGRTIPIICSGDRNSLRYCLYVEQPGVNGFTDTEKREHLLSVMLHNNENDRVAIYLVVDENGEPTHISGIEYHTNDIPPEDKEYLSELGQKNAGKRIIIRCLVDTALS